MNWPSYEEVYNEIYKPERLLAELRSEPILRPVEPLSYAERGMIRVEELFETHGVTIQDLRTGQFKEKFKSIYFMLMKFYPILADEIMSTPRRKMKYDLLEKGDTGLFYAQRHEGGELICYVVYHSKSKTPPQPRHFRFPKDFNQLPKAWVFTIPNKNGAEKYFRTTCFDTEAPHKEEIHGQNSANRDQSETSG